MRGWGSGRTKTPKVPYVRVNVVCWAAVRTIPVTSEGQGDLPRVGKRTTGPEKSAESSSEPLASEQDALGLGVRGLAQRGAKQPHPQRYGRAGCGGRSYSALSPVHMPQAD